MSSSSTTTSATCSRSRGARRNRRTSCARSPARRRCAACCKEEFAVILLDVLMPGLDGYETAQLIRQREQSKRTPIIFLTAINKEDAHMLRGYDVGAVDYVFKPFDPIMLRSKVTVFVELFEKTREIQRKAALEQKLLEQMLRANAEKLEAEQALRQSEQRAGGDPPLAADLLSMRAQSTMPFGAAFRQRCGRAFDRLYARSRFTSDAAFRAEPRASRRSACRDRRRLQGASERAPIPASFAGDAPTAPTGSSSTRASCRRRSTAARPRSWARCST